MIGYAWWSSIKFENYLNWRVVVLFVKFFPKKFVQTFFVNYSIRKKESLIGLIKFWSGIDWTLFWVFDLFGFCVIQFFILHAEAIPVKNKINWVTESMSARSPIITFSSNLTETNYNFFIKFDWLFIVQEICTCSNLIPYCLSVRQKYWDKVIVAIIIFSIVILLWGIQDKWIWKLNWVGSRTCSDIGSVKVIFSR